MRKRKFSKAKLQYTPNDLLGKPKSKTTGIIVGVIVFIMVFSSIAIAFFNSAGDNNPNVEEIDYNGFKLRNEGKGWFVNINGADYGFEYNPYDVESILSINIISEDFSGKVYILFDPSEFSEDSAELLRLRYFFIFRGNSVSFACIKEEGCGDIPIFNCEDSGKLVYLRNSENTQIYKENNCLVLDTAEGDEFRVINRFMYGILGVIDGGN